MSHKRDSEKSKTGRLPGIRILFAAVPVLLLIAAVCAVTWYIRHDTPAKAARSVKKSFFIPHKDKENIANFAKTLIYVLCR